MKTKYYLFSILAIMITMMLVVSCAPARRPGTTRAPGSTPGTRQTRVVPRNAPNRPIVSATPGPVTPNPATPNATPRDNNAGDTQSRAREIADAAARQRDVKSATCVLTGNTAMIGVQFNEQLKGKMTDAIKTEVEKKAKEADDRITRVVVTADPDMVSRIQDIFKDIGNGKPISGFTEELNEMVNRIAPK